MAPPIARNLEESSVSEPMVRASFSAARVPTLQPPFDAVQVKLHYPATWTGADAERLTGVLPPDTAHAPWPLVILINGVNVPSEGYGWLAERLARAGYAVVTYAMIGELFPPGTYGLTPGIDLAAAGPEVYPSKPTCTALLPILEHIATQPLAEHIDLDRVALGGHSAGGTLAMQNARRTQVPGVRAAFSYAGHTLASEGLGWPSDDPLVVGDAPTLMMGGTKDGIIARSADRYGRGEHDRDPITRTFEDGVRGTATLALLEGGTHQTFVHPHDETVARGFLDEEPDVDQDAARDLIGRTIVAWLDLHVRSRADAEREVRAALASPMWATVRER